MLICIDIGNTSIGFGLFSKPSTKRLKCIEKIPTHPARSVIDYREILNGLINNYSDAKRRNLKHKDVIISSVVPNLTPLIVESLKGITTKKPVFVNYKTTSGISLSIKKKKNIGADRIANAVGAFFHYNESVAVVDCGTATTITIVGKDSAIMGGAILPGIGLMQKALYSGTAKLPDISLKKPKRFLGRDTISSINSGIIHGTSGALENIILGIEQEIGYRFKIILTGGYSSLISPVLRLKHLLFPHLIFEGMRLIYLKNMNEKAYN